MVSRRNVRLPARPPPCQRVCEDILPTGLEPQGAVKRSFADGGFGRHLRDGPYYRHLRDGPYYRDHVIDVLGDPPATRIVRILDFLAEGRIRRPGVAVPFETVHVATIQDGTATVVLDVLPEQLVRARRGDRVRLLVPVHAAADPVLPDPVDIELQVVGILLGDNLPVERDRARPRYGGLHLRHFLVVDIAAIGRIDTVVRGRGLSIPRIRIVARHGREWVGEPDCRSLSKHSFPLCTVHPG